MTEAVEQVTVLKSPLDATHVLIGATMGERDGWSVPESYGDVLFEYAALRERGCGIIDFSSRGRFLVSGSEAVQFLNGLITNDMKTLAENTWMPAAFPNVQGRLIASVRVHHLSNEEKTFLIDTEPATRERVWKSLERFTLAGDFHVLDITGQTAQLSVQGKTAVNLIRMVLGDEAANIAANQVTQIAWPQTEPTKVTVICSNQFIENGFDLMVNSAEATDLWKALQNAGARPVGYDSFDTLRIEAGVPRYGVDMDDTNVVTETALDDAINYTKGCYVGQEIIARIKYRGHVAKKLAGLVFDHAVKVDANAVIRSMEDKDIGRITSRTYSPYLGRTIAMGYLKYDYLSPGTTVKVVSDIAELEARVTELPFVRRSSSAGGA